MITADQQTFWIGRNPATESRLPYLLRLPVSGEGRIFLAARDTWPRGTDVFCFQLPEWPAEAEVIAAFRVEQPRAIPLLDERAFGEAPITYEGKPRMLDASARRSLLLREAASGTLWTSRAAAERCGVTQVTALADLNALVGEATRTDHDGATGCAIPPAIARISRSLVMSGIPRSSASAT